MTLGDSSSRGNHQMVLVPEAVVDSFHSRGTVDCCHSSRASCRWLLNERSNVHMANP